MTIETDMTLARDYFVAFRDRDEDWWDRHIAPDFVRHDPGLAFEVRGPDGLRRLAGFLHGAFSDMELPVDDLGMLKQIGALDG